MAEPAFWRSRPTLVTGATGLVGSRLVARLVELGADVVCLVRDWVPQSELVRSDTISRVAVVHGDIRDGELLERILGEYGVDTVFNLAAQTVVGVAGQNPLSTYETNVGGAWTLLEACRRSPAVRQIVVASSDKAYGAQAELPYRETSPLEGRFPYDASKACSDLIAQSYAASFRLPLVISRCGNFYGGGDLNWNRIVPGTIRSVLHGDRPVIRAGRGYVRDYLYVEDGVAAYLLMAEALAAERSLIGEAFNFSTEMPMDVCDLVDRILSTAGSSLEPEILNAATNEIPRQYLDAGKARSCLGWKPGFDLDRGLAETLNWYEAFFADEPIS